jgi:hypothetical protein
MRIVYSDKIIVHRKKFYWEIEDITTQSKNCVVYNESEFEQHGIDIEVLNKKIEEQVECSITHRCNF